MHAVVFILVVFSCILTAAYTAVRSSSSMFRTGFGWDVYMEGQYILVASLSRSRICLLCIPAQVAADSFHSRRRGPASVSRCGSSASHGAGDSHDVAQAYATQSWMSLPL